MAILLKKLYGNVIYHTGDIEGNWLMVNIEHNDSNYILVNIYGFSNCARNKRLLSDLGAMIDNWMNVYSTDKIIVAGDFNFVPDEWQDRVPTLLTTHSFNPLISDFSKSLNLINIWHKLNPEKKQYTWSNNLRRTQCSRLDFWLTTNNLVEISSNCDICPWFHSKVPSQKGYSAGVPNQPPIIYFSCRVDGNIS